MDSNQCVARTMTHQDDDEEQQQRDERRAEEPFCNTLGDIGHENGPYHLSFTPITAEAKLSMSGQECHLCHLFGRQKSRRQLLIARDRTPGWKTLSIADGNCASLWYLEGNSGIERLGYPPRPSKGRRASAALHAGPKTSGRIHRRRSKMPRGRHPTARSS